MHLDNKESCSKYFDVRDDTLCVAPEEKGNGICTVSVLCL